MILFLQISENYQIYEQFKDFCLYFQFRPLEQLMGVFPAASSKHVPEPWAKLMSDPVSIMRKLVSSCYSS